MPSRNIRRLERGQLRLDGHMGHGTGCQKSGQRDLLVVHQFGDGGLVAEEHRIDRRAVLRYFLFVCLVRWI